MGPIIGYQRNKLTNSNEFGQSPSPPQVLGRELLLHLADHICTSYLAGNKETAALVHSTRIHLLPSMNPDGWKIASDHVRIITS